MKQHECKEQKDENFVFIRKYLDEWQLEITEIENTFSEYVSISYCPFCGKKL